MLVKEAKLLAMEWVQFYSQNHEIIGAYLNGSVTAMNEAVELSPFSDVDINVVIDSAEVGEKLGKFIYKGALLEVSFVTKDKLLPPEKLLSTYEIVGAFRTDNILLDNTGVLRELFQVVSLDFSKPDFVESRCLSVVNKIQLGIKAFDRDNPLLDNINPWLFPAGVCTHLLLVGAQINPTVRLRYLLLRPILLKAGFADLYEELLELIGCKDFSAAQVQQHLDALTRTYDIACQYSAYVHFPFSNDITLYSRPVVIDGSQYLIDQGNHREAVFWIAATFVRCHLILRTANPLEHQKLMPELMKLLEDMRAENNENIHKHIEATKRMLPRIKDAANMLYNDYCLSKNV
jgi:hypothetical protein